jgi:hypothetical protein
MILYQISSYEANFYDLLLHLLFPH